MYGRGNLKGSQPPRTPAVAFKLINTKKKKRAKVAVGTIALRITVRAEML